MKTSRKTPSGSAAEARPLEVRRLGLMAYGEALELQKELVVERREGRVDDLLLLLEHPHVITQGSSAVPDHLLADEEERHRLGITLFDVGRGGDVTYHGPGQLIGYPILDLKPDRRDLHRYMRDLEEVLIRALDSLGVKTDRREGSTGVWTDAGKIGAIGVRVSSGWITSHGFALNVSTDLSYFGTIIPCGLDDRRVTSLEHLLLHSVNMATVEQAIITAFSEVFGRKARWS